MQPVKIAHRVNTVLLLNNQRAKIVLPQISALRGQPAVIILKQPAQQGRIAVVLRVASIAQQCRVQHALSAQALLAPDSHVMPTR